MEKLENMIKQNNGVEKSTVAKNLTLFHFFLTPSDHLPTRRDVSNFLTANPLIHAYFLEIFAPSLCY